MWDLRAGHVCAILLAMKRYIYPESDGSRSLLMIAIGGALMIGGHFLWDNFFSARDEVTDEPAPAAVEEVYEEHSRFEESKDLLKAETQIFEKIAQEAADSALRQAEDAGAALSSVPAKIVKAKEQSWKKFAIPADLADKKGKVVIIIDDVGMAHSLSNQVIDIDAPLTLAFLPYAPNLKAMTRRAKAEGHELMIHMPMEPMNADLDVGAIALLDEMSDVELTENLGKAFASFEGYVGINNHMGSRLTQNEYAMHVVMNELAERGLLFVDSKTISTSVAGKIAAEHGLDYAERDVFLDHENNIDFVMNALNKVEIVAKKQGYAIAIGHPKKATIAGLKQWLPTLEGKGLTVVPVSAVVKNGNNEPIASLRGEAEVIQMTAQEMDRRAQKSARDDGVIEVEPASGVVEIEPVPLPLSDTRFMLTPMPVQ